MHSLYDIALRKLSYREHSTKELTTKLWEYSEDIELIEEVLALLKDHNYVNDRRFAEIYARSKSSKGIGEIRVRQELKIKGINTEDIANALSQSEIDWFELALKVKNKRQLNHQHLSFTERAKLQRFMQSRGFTFEQIKYAMSDQET